MRIRPIGTCTMKRSGLFPSFLSGTDPNDVLIYSFTYVTSGRINIDGATVGRVHVDDTSNPP